MAKFQFGNVVVVAKDQIGVIVKTYHSGFFDYNYDVYVRSYSSVENFKENEISHFVFSKELSEEELEFYK